MRKRKFSEEQIAMALRQGEAGTPVADICRKLGISQATFSVEEDQRQHSECLSSES